MVAALAQAHGCPRGCEDCARERDQANTPTDIRTWGDFVTSDDAYRVAAHARRTGAAFPRLVVDDVVQFCIEEALYERVELSEALAEARAHEESLPADVRTEMNDPGLYDALSKARHFAKTNEQLPGAAAF